MDGMVHNNGSYSGNMLCVNVRMKEKFYIFTYVLKVNVNYLMNFARLTINRYIISFELNIIPYHGDNRSYDTTTSYYVNKKQLRNTWNFMDAAYFSPKSCDLCHVAFCAKKQSSTHPEIFLHCMKDLLFTFCTMPLYCLILWVSR